MWLLSRIEVEQSLESSCQLLLTMEHKSMGEPNPGSCFKTMDQLFLFFVLAWFFETAYFIALAGLELVILLPSVSHMPGLQMC
jgi:hypothetical protein